MGMNIYIYCSNCPVNREDSNGYLWKKIKIFLKNLFGINKAPEIDLISGAAAAINGTYDLGKGYKARIDVGHVKNDQRHVHIFKKARK